MFNFQPIEIQCTDFHFCSVGTIRPDGGGTAPEPGQEIQRFVDELEREYGALHRDLVDISSSFVHSEILFVFYMFFSLCVAMNSTFRYLDPIPLIYVLSRILSDFFRLCRLCLNASADIFWMSL